MVKRILTITVVIAALGTGLAACGGSGDNSNSAAAQAPAASGTTKVSVQDNTFKPGNLTVKSGDTVTFTNDGAVPHTVTATGGADFDSGTLAPGKTFSFVAAGKGKVTYVCTFHPGMQGTIEVD